MRVIIVTLGLFLSLSSAMAQENCKTVFLQPLAFEQTESWSEQVIGREFDQLADFFIKNKSLSDSDKIEALLKVDGRKVFFKLQALMRILNDQSPVFFEKKRLFFKDLEGVIGAVDLAISLRETAAEIKEPTLVDFFSKEEKQAQSELIQKMKEAGLWTEPESAIAKMRAEFAQNGKWEQGTLEKKALVKVIADYSRELHGLVLRRKFDNPDIEKGLHKLRRSLRWINIQVIALDGIVKMKDEAKMGSRAHLLISKAIEKNPNFLANERIALAEPSVQTPIQIPRRASSMIADYVGRMGESKDSAEMQIHFTDALKALGVPSADAARVTKKLQDLLKTETVDHQALSREIMTELEATELLKEFSDSLDEMN